MATIKLFTDLEQSKKLAEILPLESADAFYPWRELMKDYDSIYVPEKMLVSDLEEDDICAWSLAALLNILHSNVKNILSLSGGGYKDGEYISDWCIDCEFENGDYQKTFANNPIDACYEIIIKLNELKML